MRGLAMSSPTKAMAGHAPTPLRPASRRRSIGRTSGSAMPPTTRALYTDTNEYADIVPECTNLSVGYQRQHGPRETLDVVHCEQLLDAMLELDASQLVIERDPSVQEDVGLWSDRGRGQGDAFG